VTLEKDVNRAVNTTRRIVQMLVEKDYDGLDLLTVESSEAAKQLVHWIEECKEDLTLPPDEAFENVNYHFFDSDQTWSNCEPFPGGWSEHNLNIYESQNEGDRSWRVDFDMWTEKEGRSDFVLQFDLSEQDDEWLIELTGLHVM
jgi:hypothetical protein